MHCFFVCFFVCCCCCCFFFFVFVFGCNSDVLWQGHAVMVIMLQTTSSYVMTIFDMFVITVFWSGQYNEETRFD